MSVFDDYLVDPRLSLLDKTRIQAQVLVPVLTALRAEMGKAKADAVVKRAVERFGRVDVLISNAGVLSPNGRIHNLKGEDWERAFRVNVMGPVNAIRAARGARDAI